LRLPPCPAAACALKRSALAAYTPVRRSQGRATVDRALDRVGYRGLRPGALSHHRTCGFPHSAVERSGLFHGNRKFRWHRNPQCLRIALFSAVCKLGLAAMRHKYFATVELERLAQDPNWLDKATRTATQYWQTKNRCRAEPSGHGRRCRRETGATEVDSARLEVSPPKRGD